MTNITREEAIKKLQDKVNSDLYFNDDKAVFGLAISDMKRVKEQRFEEIIEKLHAELASMKEIINTLEAENKHLKDGITNVKAGIKNYIVIDICKGYHPVSELSINIRERE